MKGIYRNIFLTVLALLVVALGIRLLVRQLQQDASLRLLITIENRLSADEQFKLIPCSHTPLTDSSDVAALKDALLYLANPAQQATAYCLLGDYPSALAAYVQSASSGDDESVLQVYFLLARNGDLPAARQVLNTFKFPVADLQGFFASVVSLKISIDELLPVAQRMVELDPKDPQSWQLWLAAAQEYEGVSNWQNALSAYLAAIRMQEQFGVNIGRSSFELSAGRIYQTRLAPPDLHSALSCYNSAIADMNFRGSGNLSYAFLYRGEVYLGLSPVYTASQALQEFLYALQLDPNNYWAMQDLAGIYLYNLKDYPLAEQYIDLAVSLNSALPNAYLIRGDLYRQQGNLLAAAAAYQDALARQPGYQLALDRLAALQKQSK